MRYERVDCTSQRMYLGPLSSDSTHFSNSLPRELWDHILDFLWDDRDSPAACIMTCRSWVLTAHFHIFQTIRLANFMEFKKLEQLLSDCLDIGDCIRELSVVLFWNAASHDTLHLDISGILARLPSLSHYCSSAFRTHGVPHHSDHTGGPFCP